MQATPVMQVTPFYGISVKKVFFFLGATVLIVYIYIEHL